MVEVVVVVMMLMWMVVDVVYLKADEAGSANNDEEERGSGRNGLGVCHAARVETRLLRTRCNEPGGIITENQLRPSRGRCIGVCRGRMPRAYAPMQCSNAMQCKRRVESSD